MLGYQAAKQVPYESNQRKIIIDSNPRELGRYNNITGRTAGVEPTIQNYETQLRVQRLERRIEKPGTRVL